MKAVFIKSLLIMTMSVLVLSACNKADTPKEQTQPTQSTTIDTPKSDTHVSPTVQIWIDSIKLGTVMAIKAEHPNMTPEQLACLKSDEADKTYRAKGEAEIKRILGDDLLKASDDFYSSEFGKKITAFAHQQLLIATGEQVENPLVLTEEEQAKMVKELQESEFAKKLQAESASINEEQATAMLNEFSAKEKARCGV